MSEQNKMDAELLPCPFCNKKPAPYHKGVGCVTSGCILNGLHLDYDKWQARASLPVSVPVYRKAKMADELAVALQCALDQAAADELDGWYANAVVVLDKYNNQGETP